MMIYVSSLFDPIVHAIVSAFFDVDDVTLIQ